MAGADERSSAQGRPIHTAAAHGDDATLLVPPAHGAESPAAPAVVPSAAHGAPPASARGTPPASMREAPSHGAPAEVPQRNRPVRRFMAALPGPLSRLPAQAFFASVGMIIASAIVCSAAALRSSAAVTALEATAATPEASSSATPAGSAPAAATSAPAELAPDARAPTAELDKAREDGAGALTELSKTYANDPAVWKALALAHARAKDGQMAALNATKRLLEVAPEEASDDDIRQVLLRAANAPPDVASVAFDLMAKGMGSRGPDLLYELLIASSVGKLPKERAGKLLLETEVRKNASFALLIADDLRRSGSSCPSKALLERARDQGDVRALHYLKPLLLPYGCGALNWRKCTRCINVHAEVRAAIAAIEKRRGP